jgi:HK97 family phage major capsid protein
MSIVRDLSQATARVEQHERSLEFLQYAKALLISRGDVTEFRQAAEQIRATERVKEIIRVGAKAAVPPLGLDSPGAVGITPYQLIESSFAASLAPWDAMDRIMQDANTFRRLPPRTRIVVTTAVAVGSEVGGGLPKPVSSLQFVGDAIEPVKSSAIIAVSDELALSTIPAAQNMLARELRQACGLASDRAFFSILTASTGVPSSPSSGTTLANFTADLDTALAAIAIDATSKVYLAAPPNEVKRIARMTGSGGAPAFPNMTISDGDISGITVVPSNALSESDQMVLMDATGIAVDGGTITLDSTMHATLEFSDDPTSGTPRLVSLFQKNMRGLRAERDIAVNPLRSTALAVITNVTA